MVAEVMVENLGLKLENHPKPYQLTLLKKGNVVKVKHRCLVHFSIGSCYSYEVWCEDIPMDACHILLGRLWQYDRRVSHDGYLNTYTYKKAGVNIKLVSLDIRESGNEALIVTKSEFLDFTRTTKPPIMFALVITEANPCAVEPPHAVRQLLREFVDVLPTEIPAGLPFGT